MTGGGVGSIPVGGIRGLFWIASKSGVILCLGILTTLSQEAGRRSWEKAFLAGEASVAPRNQGGRRSCVICAGAVVLRAQTGSQGRLGWTCPVSASGVAAVCNAPAAQEKAGPGRSGWCGWAVSAPEDLCSTPAIFLGTRRALPWFSCKAHFEECSPRACYSPQRAGSLHRPAKLRINFR